MSAELHAEIERLVEGKVPESIALEYKASPALARDSQKVSELQKDVSAFANSDGGRIVYGVVAKNGVPEQIDRGTDPAIITPDWVHDVLRGGIRPPLDGVLVTPVPHADAGQVLYVIDVPRGTTAHMANHSYFKRSGSAAVPMEDFEVRDVMGRSERPDVRVRFVGHPSGGELPIDVQVRNRASTPAPYFTIDLYMPPETNVIRVQGEISGRIRNIEKRRMRFENFEDEFVPWRFEWWDRMPLFSGEWESIGTMTLATRYGKHLLWAVTGPGVRRQGSYLVTGDNPSALRPTDLAWSIVSD